MKKIRVVKAFRDRETGEFRGIDTEPEYRDERADELIAGGWAVEIIPEVVEEPIEEKPVAEKKPLKGKKKKK